MKDEISHCGLRSSHAAQLIGITKLIKKTYAAKNGSNLAGFQPQHLSISYN